MADWYIDYNKTGNYLSVEFPLIHKCDKLETLISIIKTGFRFSYSKEDISDSSRTISAYFPMISFSDLSYDKAIVFLGTYGVFGIGMTKEWAQKNRLTPVLYFEKYSNIAKTLIENFDILSNVSYQDTISSLNNTLIGERHKFYKFIIEIASYSKNFYAPLFRKGNLIEPEYSFGMEREWRVVLEHENISRYITKNLYNKNEIENAPEHFLKFNFSDIEYFLIEEEYQKIKIKEELINKFKVTEQHLEKIKFYYNNSRVCYED